MQTSIRLFPTVYQFMQKEIKQKSINFKLYRKILKIIFSTNSSSIDYFMKKNNLMNLHEIYTNKLLCQAHVTVQPPDNIPHFLKNVYKNKSHFSARNLTYEINLTSQSLAIGPVLVKENQISAWRQNGTVYLSILKALVAITALKKF